MDRVITVSPQVFKAIQELDVKAISACSAAAIRPILPTLSRISLLPLQDTSKKRVDERIKILAALSGIEAVNAIVAWLSIDFHALEIDVRRELQIRFRSHPGSNESAMAQPTGLSFEFERGDNFQSMRLVLFELFRIEYQANERREQGVIYSELFDPPVYQEKICDILSIALAELPALLNITEVAEYLLHVRFGPWIICRLVANMPDSFREVCTSLIATGDKQEDENPGFQARMKALRLLCQMNPSQALDVRDKCVELGRMPALAILLTMPEPGQDGSDIVAFVSGLLISNDPNSKWFSHFVRNSQKRKQESHTALVALRAELTRQLEALVPSGGQLEASKVAQASVMLRLFCALRGIAGIKFQDEEVTLIVKLVTSHPPPSVAGVHFVSLGLCMLIACPSLIQPEHEKKSVDWVKWLVQEEAYFESASGVKASFGEMLLLMAIHFHSNQLSAVCDLVCSTLGMKINIRPNNLNKIRGIFVNDIFTEQVVTAHAVKVPVTANLSGQTSGFLPVHCIYQLLKSRAFSKHRVPIKDWIYRQICFSDSPLHPVLPSLVEVYVGSILVPANKALDQQTHTTNEPISEAEIKRVFNASTFQSGSKESQPSLTSQLLLLYYVLHYEDLRLSSQHRNAKAYSSEFLAQLPIKYLLQQAQREQQNLGGLFAPLLKLLATHFPHLSLVNDWFETEPPSLGTTISNLPLNSDDILKALVEVSAHPLRTIQVLQRLADMPPTEAWSHAEMITSQFKAILGYDVPRQVQELYQRVWLRLNTVLPRSLWVMTVNALLLPEPGHDTLMVPLTQEDVVLDPLQVLRCDERVFRCAPALSVVLRVLQAGLAASRSHLARQLQDLQVAGTAEEREMKERHDLRIALTASQESAAIQVLLETCLENKQDKEKPGENWALRECRGVVCSYLHQAFIADTNLAKLVHFQGYPMELLPVTVAGIPSMHICLDYLPEMLSQPETEKQIFAVNLASHLSLQFAMPKSLSIAKLCITVLSALLNILPSTSRAQFYAQTLGALVRFSQAFPPLMEEIMNFLQQLGRVEISQGALTGHSCKRGPGRSAVVPQDNFCLCQEIEDTFEQIMGKAVLSSTIY
ncbi:integrator complex subunit 2 [Cloeon dipterum]|uniref:integrator complex subunit 2 n=1 Tax=Cloeon dipterum TaxID=197152 RepID=UPI00321F7C93